MRTNFSSTVSENESLSEICHCLEKRPKVSCSDRLPPFFKALYPAPGPGSWNCFFLSLKWLEGCCFFLQNREKLVVSSLRKVKPPHRHCALVQRAVYLNLGETIRVESRELYLLSVFFYNSRVSYFPLISSSCCICDCSLFQHHRGAKALACFLFLAAVSLKNECWLLWSFISLPFWCNTSVHVCRFCGKN